jgi:hypothetical protein
MLSAPELPWAEDVAPQNVHTPVPDPAKKGVNPKASASSPPLQELHTAVGPVPATRCQALHTHTVRDTTTTARLTRRTSAIPLPSSRAAVRTTRTPQRSPIQSPPKPSSAIENAPEHRVPHGRPAPTDRARHDSARSHAHVQFDPVHAPQILAVSSSTAPARSPSVEEIVLQEPRDPACCAGAPKRAKHLSTPPTYGATPPQVATPVTPDQQQRAPMFSPHTPHAPTHQPNPYVRSPQPAMPGTEPEAATHWEYCEFVYGELSSCSLELIQLAHAFMTPEQMEQVHTNLLSIEALSRAQWSAWHVDHYWRTLNVTPDLAKLFLDLMQKVWGALTVPDTTVPFVSIATARSALRLHNPQGSLVVGRAAVKFAATTLKETTATSAAPGGMLAIAKQTVLTAMITQGLNTTAKARHAPHITEIPARNPAFGPMFLHKRRHPEHPDAPNWKSVRDEKMRLQPHHALFVDWRICKNWFAERAGLPALRSNCWTRDGHCQYAPCNKQCACSPQALYSAIADYMNGNSQTFQPPVGFPMPPLPFPHSAPRRNTTSDRTTNHGQHPHHSPPAAPYGTPLHVYSTQTPPAYAGPHMQHPAGAYGNPHSYPTAPQPHFHHHPTGNARYTY